MHGVATLDLDAMLGSLIHARDEEDDHALYKQQKNDHYGDLGQTVAQHDNDVLVPVSLDTEEDRFSLGGDLKGKKGLQNQWVDSLSKDEVGPMTHADVAIALGVPENETQKSGSGAAVEEEKRCG